MRVLVLGGTGSIGSAVVQVLQQRNHEVLALARSATARDKLINAGARPIDGDIKRPGKWLDCIEHVDGVIHAAIDWEDLTGEVDQLVVRAVLGSMDCVKPPKAFIYTGGCWLYGQTGDLVATEATPLSTLDEYAGAVRNLQQVLAKPGIRGMVVHPAMVYERSGGVFESFVEDARTRGYIRVIGGDAIRWPLVHRLDLAVLYALMMEKGQHGDVYNAAATVAMTTGLISRAIAGRFGVAAAPHIVPVDQACRELGSWASGYALDQQMSGQKAMDKLGWQPEFNDALAVIA